MLLLGFGTLSAQVQWKQHANQKYFSKRNLRSAMFFRDERNTTGMILCDHVLSGRVKERVRVMAAAHGHVN